MLRAGRRAGRRSGNRQAPFLDPAANARPLPPPTEIIVTPSDNLQEAFDAAAAKGIKAVKIKAGLYEQAAVVKSPCRVTCDDGAIFRNKIVEGKAAIVIRTDEVEWIGGRFEHPSANFEGEANVAAFRLEGKNIAFRKVYIRDYQMGVLGGTIYNWKTKRLQTDRGYVRFYDCDFADIGKVSWDNKLWQNLSHLIYIAAYEELTVQRCKFGPTWGYGHQLKSRCRNTNILDCAFDQGSGPGSLAIAIENGGNALIKNVSIVHGARSDNADVIGYAKEYWGDTPGNDKESEYYGLFKAEEKLWPGNYVMALENVSLVTQVTEAPHSNGRIGLVKGPNLPSLGLTMKNVSMTAINKVPLEFTMDRAFVDLGGNVK